jgi:hypothetical protein
MPSLSAVATLEYYTELGNALPPPMTDTPEYRQRRLTTAVEAFEALRPGDAYEASLAVRIVLAGAHAVETLREAGVYREDFAKRKSCRAQAASMMREERAAKRMLAQEQKLRLATEAVAGTAPAQPALASVPPPQAEPQAAPPPVQAAAPPPPPVPAPPPVAAPSPAAIHAPPPLPVQAGSAPPPSPEAIARAEAFVDEDVVAAAQIRHDRGVTPQHKARFRHLTLPSDPAVIDALVRGTSDVLTVLDEVSGETLNVAA